MPPGTHATMTSSLRFSVYFVQLSVLMSSLVFRSSHSTLKVTVVNVTSYTATVRWELEQPSYTNLTGFNLTNEGDFSMNTIQIVHDVGARVHVLNNLDDMRAYNACVATLVPAPEVPEVGCAEFSTPLGASTAIAIASGLFLIICLATFAILDFVVSKSRNKLMVNKKDELLEQGWKTFQRHSKGRGKVNDVVAPDLDRPVFGDSVDERHAGVPSSAAVCDAVSDL